MTTATDTGSLVFSNDAEFRSIVTLLSDLLDDAGFTKAGDTGQINPATVSKPGSAGVSAGFEIRYLDDSLHGTKPCYVKIEYGTGPFASTHFAVWITVASGTNGAGTVSGTTYLARTQVSTNSAPIAGSWPSFACTKEGYAFLAAYRRSTTSNSPCAFFAIMRTTDTSGTPTATGFHFYCGDTSTGTVTRTSYTDASYYDGKQFAMIPGANTSSGGGGNYQLFRHFGMQPTVVCVPYLLTYFDSEVGNETTFTATPLGVTLRTYLALGGTAGPIGAASSGASSARLAVQWD